MPRRQNIPAGYERNPLTNRKVKINSPTYKRLYRQLHGDRYNRRMSLDELFRLNGAEGYDVDPYTNRVLRKDSEKYRQLRQSLHGDEYDSSLTLNTLRQLYKNNMNRQITKMFATRHPITDKVLIVGSDEWNEVYRQYNWDGKNKKFTTRRDHALPPHLWSVKDRRFANKSKYSRINKEIEEGTILKTSMGSYATVYYVEQGIVNAVYRNSIKGHKDFTFTKDEDGTYHVMKKGTNDKKTIRKLMCNKSDFEVDDNDIQEIYTKIAEYIQQCETDAPQYYMCLAMYDNYYKYETNSEGKKERQDIIFKNFDNRLPYERVVTKNHELEWSEAYIRNDYLISIELPDLEGSGWIYGGNMGFSFSIIPLTKFIGAGIPTPSILGYTVLNACINDNKCLQRSLILACNGDYYVKTKNICRESSYNKYWKKPQVNQVFGHTIQEIETAVNIEDNKPFVECDQNFKTLEDLLNIYINCYEFDMQDGFDPKDVSESNYSKFYLHSIYPHKFMERKDRRNVDLCVLKDASKNIKHFVYIKDPSVFKQHVLKESSTKNRHTKRDIQCRWCMFKGCKSLVLKHEIRCHPEEVPEKDKYILDTSDDARLKWCNQRYQMYAPAVVYADFESSINERGEHNPIILSAACVSRIPNVKTEYKVFRGPNETVDDFLPFIDYLMDIKKTVVNELYNEEKMIVTPEVQRDYEDTTMCPFCGVPLITKDEMSVKRAAKKDTEQDDEEEEDEITPEQVEEERMKIFDELYEKYCQEWDNTLQQEYEHYMKMYNTYYEEACAMNRNGSTIDADIYAKNKLGDKPRSRDIYATVKASEEMRAKVKSENKAYIECQDNKRRMMTLNRKIRKGKANKTEKKEYEQLRSTNTTNARVKVRHHAHIAGEYSDGVESRQYAAGEYICTCCSRCNTQLSFNKKSYKLPVYFHNGGRYDNAFIMKLVAKWKAIADAGSDTKRSPYNLEVIPTSMDKEMLITINGIDFKDSYRMISNKLKDIVNQTLGSDLNNYVVTKQLLKQYLEDHHKHYDDSYIELMTRKEPMFYSLITSYQSLSNTKLPDIVSCYDELSRTEMSIEDYNHMKTLWKTFNIMNWGEYYELYNVLDVTLLADAFEHFRTATHNSFGVDAAHYLTTPQMSYSLFLKYISNEDTTRFSAIGDEWAKYEMKIGATEGRSEQEMQEIYMKRMNEYTEAGGIRLLSMKDMDTFISLNHSLRGGITQIVTRHAKTPVEADAEHLRASANADATDKDYDPNSRILYLDANNLYGGTMMRMMPYDIVDDTKNDWKAIKSMGKTAWVKSLDTFDQYGFFIECDIECDKSLHDYFSDFPLFPVQRTGMYSPAMREFAKRVGIEDMINENDKTQKLICDLCPKSHYVVHYNMLQLGLKLGYRVTKIHNIIKFRQAPFIFEYVNHLSKMRAQAATSVLKNLFKLLANSIYGKFVESGLKRMKVKIATNKKEQDAIISKYMIDMIEDNRVYSENLWVSKLFNPVKKMNKPFFIGFAILDLSKYIIYDFYYNKLKKNFDSVTLLGQDTDSLIVKITDPSIDDKMLDMYKSFDFSELNTESYFYNKLVEYYNTKVNHEEFSTLKSFVNFNKKVAGPIFKDEHNGFRITEFVGLRPKLYCIEDERNIIHNACKGVPRNVFDSKNNRINIKNIDTYKRVLFATTKDAANLTGEFSRIEYKDFNLTTKTQRKTLFTCLDNKRYVCDDNIHTRPFGYSSAADLECQKYCT